MQDQEKRQNKERRVKSRYRNHGENKNIEKIIILKL